MEMSKLQKFNKEYEELKAKGVKLNNITLEIHMPTGETESIVNPNIEEKVKYINRVYDENLVHSNCSNLYIKDYIFVEEDFGMDFGFALAALKDGKKIARKGWNGKGMYVTLILAGNAAFQGYAMQDCLGLKTANDVMQPGWIPSQNDLLSEDWMVVE